MEERRRSPGSWSGFPFSRSHSLCRPGWASIRFPQLQKVLFCQEITLTFTYQEVVYSKHGKHPREALFYTHALPLPGFLLLAPDILNHWNIVLSSPPLPMLPMVPSMLLYLVGNIITQYLCISAVFVLTTECASLTVTLVVTLRKFLSLLFSIWYFSNPFTTLHWLGTALVFGGTLVFSDVPKLLRESREETKEKTS